MASLKPLIQLTDLRTNFVAHVAANKPEKDLHVNFDPDLDELLVLLVPKDEEYSVYFIDQYIGLLYQPDSLEIIGVMVENFEQGFLKKYPTIQQIWNKTKQVTLEVARVTEELIGEPGTELVAAIAA